MLAPASAASLAQAPQIHAAKIVSPGMIMPPPAWQSRWSDAAEGAHGDVAWPD